MKTKLLASPEASEIAKLTETTYFGLLIAWAQEVERYCMKLGANYDEVVSFYEEIKFFPPVKYFPGEIGGHCVMPNIDILLQKFPSGLLQAIVQSNTLKQKNFGPDGWLESSRSSPRTSAHYLKHFNSLPHQRAKILHLFAPLLLPTKSVACTSQYKNHTNRVDCRFQHAKSRCLSRKNALLPWIAPRRLRADAAAAQHYIHDPFWRKPWTRCSCGHCPNWQCPASKRFFPSRHSR